MGKSFRQRFGFDRPPTAFFSGFWRAFQDGIEAKLTCKTCGGEVNIFFHGNPNSMTEAGIKNWILLRAENHHECPAVQNILDSKRKKYFADIYRGIEKKYEEDQRLLKGSFSGKPAASA